MKLYLYGLGDTKEYDYRQVVVMAETQQEADEQFRIIADNSGQPTLTPKHGECIVLHGTAVITYGVDG